MYYGARYYSPEVRVFTQPDTLLPDPYDPQALNRYSYALNNPLKYSDPSGHIIDVALDLGFIGMDVVDIYNDPSDTWAWAALGADVVCAVIPVATGGGLGVKALKKGVQETDNIGDLFKLLDNTDDAGKCTDDVIGSIDDVKWVSHDNKHIANKNFPWKKIIEGTKHGPAKYAQNMNVDDIEKLERKVWNEGISVETKGSSYKIMEFDDVIGASSGKETNYVMV
jgi:pyocin large subunit-like protein